MLSTSFDDAFPDAKKLGCAIVLDLTAALAPHLEPHCAPLARALQPCLVHQHSRVRGAGTEALVALLIVEPSALVEIHGQLALIATDRAPAVRELALAALTRLFVHMPQRRAHSARLLPLLLCSLCDDVDAIREQAQRALTQLGDLCAAPEPSAETPAADMRVAADAADGSADADVDGARSERAAKAAAEAAAASSSSAGARASIELLENTPFAGSPAVGAAAMVGRDLHLILPPLLRELSDWTAKARLRAAHTLLGAVWYAGPAVGEHLQPTLMAFAKCIEDTDEGVQRQVRRCACVVGASCELGTYLPLVMRQLQLDRAAADADADGDAGVVGKRGLWLTLLGSLTAGASAAQLAPHLPELLGTVAKPTFCVPQARVVAATWRATAVTLHASRRARYGGRWRPTRSAAPRTRARSSGSVRSCRRSSSEPAARALRCHRRHHHAAIASPPPRHSRATTTTITRPTVLRSAGLLALLRAHAARVCAVQRSARLLVAARRDGHT